MSDSEARFFGVDYLVGILRPEQVNAVLSKATSFPESDDKFSYGALGMRSSKTARLPRIPDTEWLYDWLMFRARAFNQRFKFEFESIEEPLQVIRYREGERVDWHIDCGGPVGAGGRRKLSMTVQLSDGGTYDGGDLEFLGRPLHAFVRTIGTTIAFPSFLAHRVSEVTRGERYSLVAFFEGEPFR